MNFNPLGLKITLNFRNFQTENETYTEQKVRQKL